MSVESALALIESVKDFKVLFVGDTIIDEYQYVSVLNKSPKENLIPVKYLSSEVFQGGVHAAARHCESFCKAVTVATDGNGVRKVRMVDKNDVRKLFEIHYNGHITPIVERDTAGFDCVIAVDFGHGLIDSKAVEWLTKTPYLAVNAQTNSANSGFNLITKYRHSDYIVIDEPEARLAAHDRDSPIETVMEKLANGRCLKLIVTHGFHGAYAYDVGRSEFAKLPALSNTVVDTMGAGDAFLAITAPMSKTGSIEDLLLIGNAAGAIKCQITGHRSPVTKNNLIGFLKKHDSFRSDSRR